MNPRSIRVRLSLWYSGVLGLLLVTFSVATYLGLERYLTSVLRQSVISQAREVVPLFSHLDNKDEQREIVELRAHYAPEANNRFLRVRRDTGSVIYVSGVPKDQSFDPAEIPSTQPPLAQESTQDVFLSGGTRLLLYAIPFETRDGRRLIIEAGATYAQVDNVTSNVWMIFAFSLPVFMVVAVAGGYALSRRALRPIDEITRRAEQITSQNLSERLPAPKTNDEVERLSVALNRMIERLERAFESIHRFSADASHELRTPLTILRGELELVAQRRDLSPAISETISSALEEIDRLTKITESLLVISRLDAGESGHESQEFNLAELARVTTEQMTLLASEKEIELCCDTPVSAQIHGNPLRIKQVLVNLLDNAIKYTPKKGKINVAVAVANGCVTLEVADDGPGINPAALPHIFERFYRVDKARTRKFGGVGLGLSIAKSICVAHGGEIKVESAEGQGSRFSVHLPAAVQPLSFSKTSRRAG